MLSIVLFSWVGHFVWEPVLSRIDSIQSAPFWSSSFSFNCELGMFEPEKCLPAWFLPELSTSSVILFPVSFRWGPFYFSSSSQLSLWVPFRQNPQTLFLEVKPLAAWLTRWEGGLRLPGLAARCHIPRTRYYYITSSPTGLDKDSLVEYEGRHEVPVRGRRRRGEVEGVCQHCGFGGESYGDQWWDASWKGKNYDIFIFPGLCVGIEISLLII